MRLGGPELGRTEEREMGPGPWPPYPGRKTRGEALLPQERQMESARRPGTMIAFDSDKRRDRSTFGQVSPQEICNLKTAAQADSRTNVVSNCNAEP